MALGAELFFAVASVTGWRASTYTEDIHQSAFASFDSLLASWLFCIRFFETCPAKALPVKQNPRFWCARTGGADKGQGGEQTYIRLNVYDHRTMSFIARPEVAVRKAPQVKGPIRCHKCQLVCRDGAEYLSHKCEPRPDVP